MSGHVGQTCHKLNWLFAKSPSFSGGQHKGTSDGQIWTVAGLTRATKILIFADDPKSANK